MAVETVFLTVLVVALVIGNVLLSFVSGNGNNNSSKNNAPPMPSYAERGELNNIDLSAEQAKSSVLFSNFTALNQKINLVNLQLDRVSEKLRKLDHFKANTAIELKAIKEILIELQNKYITTSSKKVKNSKKLTGKQMHKIIYRSR